MPQPATPGGTTADWSSRSVRPVGPSLLIRTMALAVTTPHAVTLKHKERSRRDGIMRAMDCSAPGTHEDIHFTAGSEEDLVNQVRAHRDEYHADMSDEQIDALVTSSAYDE